MLRSRSRHTTALMIAAMVFGSCGAATAAVRVEGQARAGGGPLTSSTVTLWAASSGEPRQLAQTRTGADGGFQLNSQENVGTDVILYLTAQGGDAAASKVRGDNAAVAFLAVLGSTPPAKVVINEMTTVASVWTHAQFISGTAIKGHPLGLRIAAGNVPNLVDLQTGGWGTTIQDAINSTQTTTMANVTTLSSLLAGCALQIKPDACASVFAVTTPPAGKAPSDTLTAFEAVAHNPAYQARPAVCAAGRVLPGSRRQDDAPDALPAIS